ncbi:hypothetical protein [Roseofilum casamattae]|uniref:Recombinase family protein n=1 Tax=Roseofilum casamattae BLCC-M143 TaxID=3022442 RepID=A0ABT7BVG5_9CYAN|nr:hypothetical protein [Roseofilum casamattae]MDJ1183175.1 recombinase family protein [Roseofilum casamattae BLCC-M143]
MFSAPHWITGPSRSGKTSRLLYYISQELEPELEQPPTPAKPLLILAATGDNRLDLDDRLARIPGGANLGKTTTPLGFILDQVGLFWPQLMTDLGVRSQFPVRLRPETEQDLATRLWRSQLDDGTLRREGVSETRLVRQILDVWALSAASGTPISDIATILETGQLGGSPELWQKFAEALEQWRDWCLRNGLLTYGLALDLYGQHLIGDRRYQDYLLQRYRGICADDVDEYPAIARELFALFIDRDRPALFTYNPDGAIRLGLNADPQYMAQLSDGCTVEALSELPQQGLAGALSLPCVQMALDPLCAAPTALPEDLIISLQTISRADLLRQTARTIIDAVKNKEIEPEEIAIIAPGLDDIARYTLIQLLDAAKIPLRPLNEQRPLAASPPVRALLTLLALVYPGLGRLLRREAIAEMLTVLSHPLFGATQPNQPPPYWIDPARAGLIADSCYVPDPEHPHLLEIQEFPRWDRLGYRPSTAYTQIRGWIEQQKADLAERLLPNPPIFLDRAINRFFLNHTLAYNQLAAIRELMETAQHYWTLDRRLHADTPALTRFIQLLQQGAIAANPYPVRPSGPKGNAITLATIFQYRSARRSHRWHFWLDASSPLWLKGGSASLFAAPLFLQHRLGAPWTIDESEELDRDRLRRILFDLLSRVEEKLYLCHSDLAVNGTEQTGPLFSLVSASISIPGSDSSQ